ncbi:MAG: hypothetical protein GF350_01330 [Chitinivibrionales bacterium]|nr:hypothetical protein [Chitinivibrionales bacterium]
MKLRMVAGRFKGQYITVRGQAEKFRPTLERNRRAVADAVQPLIDNACVGDFCAGSGAIGFELISRGAKKVCFVENNRIRSQGIRKQADRWGINAECSVVENDIRSYVGKCTERFDIIYFDPPYDVSDLSLIVPRIIQLLKPDGVLLYERRRRRGEKKSFVGGNPCMIKKKIMGDSVIEFFRNDNIDRIRE